MRLLSADFIGATQCLKRCTRRPDIRLQPHLHAKHEDVTCHQGGVHIRHHQPEPSGAIAVRGPMAPTRFRSCKMQAEYRDYLQGGSMSTTAVQRADGRWSK